MQVSIFKDFAKKYFLEAEIDLQRAKQSLKNKDYPMAIFFFQQCVEKSVNALLWVKNENSI